MVKNRQLLVADFLMVLKFSPAFWGRRRQAMRSMCVGVDETGGINTYAKHVCWRRRDRGSNIVRPRRIIKQLFFSRAFE